MKETSSSDILLVIILLWVIGGVAAFKALASAIAFGSIACLAVMIVVLPYALLSSKFGRTARERKFVKKTREIRNKFPKELRKKYPTIENAWVDFVSRYVAHFGLNKKTKKLKTRFYKHYFNKIKKVAAA